jgi:hypothetical protein
VTWDSVRCVFRFPGDLFEERITLWRAASFDDAISLAEAEAAQYVKDVDGDYVGLAQAYLLAADLAEGAEVFSLIRGSGLTTKDYLDRFFDTGAERQQR